MTESEKLRLDVQRLTAELDATRQQTRAYLQNVAHQLTAPLGAIKWNIDAIQNPRLPQHRRDALSRSIYSQATILVHLIRNFALMSNLDADKELGQLKNEDEVELRHLVLNVARNFRPQAREQNKFIDVNEDTFLAMPSGQCVRIEKNLAAQALSNIVENAVKYASPGSTIAITASGSAEARVSVTSTGIPISASDSEKIFARGFRGETARQTVAPGTGIGLYLANRIMELHDGRIVLETQEKISRFTLIFPQKRFV